mmetsp:Transcript_72274/g.127740  ORF Transcript_72274/g.127740 Transcript_72274/m.127740 type:complete len:366 (+) Transcript_72274:96-1193(+)|eukprot:CAMPEP_0197639108 /NCGR_PEP_ID=MMETSP1338-20131121/13829_1 /TAXON_ID=43686 ORGANISM="Pelagodinium beii, Strain RCC1491" /NCGR_SAMPLE_ID=MMETSP1338 /ASSEMBLY_ACC=CAM_ASM_000754 /LENGTH=365 /DNA_ID=CAMNT_0043211789 /DNA_START=79 /DNA_END=1176 /DNA_ORIENTATION=+
MQFAVKHTFLHLVDEEELEQKTILAKGSSTRARSEEVERRLSPAISKQSQLCIERMNKLLTEPSFLPAVQIVGKEADPAEHGPSVDELRQLQKRIAATAGRPSTSERPKLSLYKRIESNGSVSTMAPDPISDCEERASVRLGGMPKAWSSGSVSSMASEYEEMHQPASYGKIDQCELRTENALDRERLQADAVSSPWKGSRVAAARDGTKAEFCHNLVPKNLNLAEEFSKSAPQGPPTTMMIRNIPNRYTQRDLMKEMEGLGFGGTYDFFYLPVDKGTLCNVGYAFVNFVDPSHAQRSMEVFKDYVFLKYRKAKGKIAAVSVAHLQGLEANIRHYENSAVNGAPRIKHHRGPIIIPHGQMALQMA